MSNLLTLNRLRKLHTLAVSLGVTLIVGLLWVDGSMAGGRRAVIEFGADQGDIALDGVGDSWSAEAGCSALSATSTSAAFCALALNDNLASEEITLGFDVTIGANTYNTIFIHENGVVTFGPEPLDDDLDSSTIAADIAALAGSVARPFIAAFHANLILPDNNLFGNSVFYFRGSADPTAPYHPLVAGDTNEPDERVPALAVTWRDANIPIVTQLVLYSTNDGTGNFDLRLRYGDEVTDLYNGLAGFSLNTGVTSDSVTVDNPLGGGDLVSSGGDLFYKFRDGHFVVPNADLDGDSVLNATDNCLSVDNVDQANLDGDDFGDVCDTDLDGDGDLNVPAQDNCPNLANPNQADSNGNGIGDACDTAPPAPTVCRVDADNDVDALDILAILKVVSKKASGPTDPRDPDRNGKITLVDAAKCTQMCTRKYCALK